VKGFGPLFGMLADRIEALLANKGMTSMPSVRNSPRRMLKRSFQLKVTGAYRSRMTAESYLGFVALASVTLWLPFVHVAQSKFDCLRDCVTGFLRIVATSNVGHRCLATAENCVYRGVSASSTACGRRRT